jgi:hypothetical protein
MNASCGLKARLGERQRCANRNQRDGARDTTRERADRRCGSRYGVPGADSATIAIDHYVERALQARTAQGLPATIEDRETLDRLALLMTATRRAPAAETPATAHPRADLPGVIGDATHGTAPKSRQRHRPSVGRPRPGANQFGAGSFSTQHVAGYGEDATPAGRGVNRGGVA